MKALAFQTLHLVAVWALLYLWQVIAPHLGCPSSAVYLWVFWVLIGAATGEVALMRRQAFVEQYLARGGLLSRLLRRRVFLLAWQALKSLAMALLLVVLAVRMDTPAWLVLLADAVLMSLLMQAMQSALRSEIRPPLLAPLARQWAHHINAVLLWVALAVLQYYTPHENYTGLDWNEAVGLATANVDVGCDVLAVLVRIDAAGEALAWWAAQNHLGSWLQGTGAIAGWLVFIAGFGISFLFAWTWSRLLAGIAARPWRLLR